MWQGVAAYQTGQFCYSLCCDFLRAGYEEGCLGTVIVSDGENGIIFLRLRKFGDEVKGDDFKWICLWFREYRCQQSLGGSGVDLVALAFCTSPKVLYHVLPESRPLVLPLDQVCGLTNSWVTVYGSVMVVMNELLCVGRLSSYNHPPIFLPYVVDAL